MKQCAVLVFSLPPLREWQRAPQLDIATLVCHCRGGKRTAMHRPTRVPWPSEVRSASKPYCIAWLGDSRGMFVCNM
eukprot:1402790-Lingulodinium_polyedra.AAC.1